MVRRARGTSGWTGRWGWRAVALVFLLLPVFVADGARVRADDAPSPLPVARAADGREIAPDRVIVPTPPG